MLFQLFSLQFHVSFYLRGFVTSSLTWRAHAGVLGSVVDAGCAVLADALCACVELVLAADAGELSRAGAVQAGAEVPEESKERLREIVKNVVL